MNGVEPWQRPARHANRNLPDFRRRGSVAGMSWRALSTALLVAITVLCGGSWTRAQEVQRHGVVFEEWVRGTFFDGYRPESHTQKWDIPAEANRRHGGVAVNPKAIKWRTSVDLGDALRQFDIDEPFILVIGYWIQDGPKKRFVKIVAPRIEPEQWRALWGPVTRADLQRLDAMIKDRDIPHQEVRRRAKAMKAGPPFSEAVFTLNPKIDSKGQRRLQCSLRFDEVFARLLPGVTPTAEDAPELWGVAFPGPIESGPRKL